MKFEPRSSTLGAVASTSTRRFSPRLPHVVVLPNLGRRWRLVSTRPLAVAAWTLVAVVGLGLALIAYSAQLHFTQQYELGATLNGWQNFLREGAPWQTVMPAVVAGALALIGWRRLLNATPEPTIGLPGMSGLSAPSLRATLRRERRGVLVMVNCLTALVLVVVVRLPVYLALALNGAGLARHSLPGVTLQAVAWVLCGACFWLWRARYLRTLESWGVPGGR